MGALRVEGAALAAFAAATGASGADLVEARSSVRADALDALAGAGELAADLDDGLLTFSLSWGSALSVLSGSAQAVGELATRTASTIATVDQELAQGGVPR